MVRLHFSVALKLCLSVDAVGACCLVFRVRCMVGSVEDIVGGNLYKPSVSALDGLCQECRCLGVEQMAQVGVALSLVNSGVGSAVYDAVDSVAVNKCVEGRRVGYIQLCHVGVEERMLWVLLLKQLHLVAQLSVAACDKYVHVIVYYI